MQNPVAPLSVLSARPIGIVNLTDDGENDDKIICVHIDDPQYQGYKSIEELPAYELRELEWFFEDYQDVLHLQVDVEGFLGTEHAHESIRKCRQMYKDKFPRRLARIDRVRDEPAELLSETRWVRHHS